MAILKIRKVNAWPTTPEANTVYYQKNSGEIGCKSRITTSAGAYLPLYPFLHIDGTVSNNLVTFKPTTGAFTSSTQSSNLYVWADGTSRITMHFIIYTQALTKGTASGTVKLEFDSSLNSLFKFGQNPAYQFASFSYNSLSSGLPPSIVSAKLVASFGVNSWIQLNKSSPSGFSPYDDNAANPLLVSDLVDHASGQKNLLIIDVSAGWSS